MHLIIIIIYYSKNLYSQIQNIINKISFSLENFELFKLPAKEDKNKVSCEKKMYKKESKKMKENNQEKKILKNQRI